MAILKALIDELMTIFQHYDKYRVMLKLASLLAVFPLLHSGILCGNTLGDFRSRASGNWSDHSVWQYYNGSGWENATPGQVPGFDSRVTIGARTVSHTISVDIADAVAGEIIMTSPSSTSLIESNLTVTHSCSLFVLGSITNDEALPRGVNRVRINVRGFLEANEISLQASRSGTYTRTVSIYIGHNGNNDALLKLERLELNSINEQDTYFYLYGRVMFTGDTYLSATGPSTWHLIYPLSEVILAGDGYQEIKSIGKYPGFTSFYNLTLAGSGYKRAVESLFIGNNLAIFSGETDFDSQGVTVAGSFEVHEGLYSGGNLSVATYENRADMIRIDGSSELISGFSATVNFETLYPQRINRQWNLSGVYSGLKVIHLSWSEVDDGSYSWTNHNCPAVFRNGQLQADGLWNDVEPRKISLETESFGVGGVEWTVGLFTGETLPVELSHFSAAVTSSNLVELRWTAESETGMLGYNLFRSNNFQIADAEKVNFTIIPAHNSSSVRTYSYTDDSIVLGNDYYYWLQIVDLDLTYEFYGPVHIEASEADEDFSLPIQDPITALESPFPNPFNAKITIPYHLCSPGVVTLALYNSKGQLINLLVDSVFHSPGTYYQYWDGSNITRGSVQSGICFLQLKTDSGFISTRRILLLQ